MAEVLQKIIDADVLVFASPVYFYSVDAQLKALIDRIVARWLEVKDKEFYYIVTAADEEKVSADTTIACFRGYAERAESHHLDEFFIFVFHYIIKPMECVQTHIKIPFEYCF